MGNGYCITRDVLAAIFFYISGEIEGNGMMRLSLGCYAVFKNKRRFVRDYAFAEIRQNKDESFFRIKKNAEEQNISSNSSK